MFELLITLLLIYCLFTVLFTGVVLESKLIVRRLIGLDISGECCGEETVSTLFIGETIPIRIAEKRLPAMSDYFFVLMCDGIVSNQELIDR